MFGFVLEEFAVLYDRSGKAYLVLDCREALTTCALKQAGDDTSAVFVISLDIVWIVLDKVSCPGEKLNLPVDVQSFRTQQYPATLSFRD